MLAIPYSLVVRISGFHPEDPGSIPGVGNLFEFLDGRSFVPTSLVTNVKYEKYFFTATSTSRHLKSGRQECLR